tara:strand:- start:181 stop:960 length:780 start_codon:yes stop_codon:yes gene_type:complete
MKTLIYQVYTGKRSKLYDVCTASVKEYSSRIKADYIVQRHPILCIKPDVFATNRSKESYMKYGGFLPIYEKENSFNYLKTYDQVAVIDADVFVRESVNESIFEEAWGSEFAAVVERDMPITEKYAQKIANYSQMQYSNIRTVDWKWNKYGAEFMNMGVMVMSNRLLQYLKGQTPAQFLNRPRFKPFIDGMGAWKWSTDQTLLNTWIREENMKIRNLDWKWNGLFTANEKIKKCNFVHFFLKDLLPQRGENVEELMELIK